MKENVHIKNYNNLFTLLKGILSHFTVPIITYNFTIPYEGTITRPCARGLIVDFTLLLYSGVESRSSRFYLHHRPSGDLILCRTNYKNVVLFLVQDFVFNVAKRLFALADVFP